MQIHPNLADLAGLLGTWRGPGAGSYPTIDDFDYLETVTFTTDGRPFFAYQQMTTSPDGKPMHQESGYLRGVGDNNVEWVISQPSGIVEVSPGRIVRSGDEVHIVSASTTVGLAPTAKRVDGVERRFELSADGSVLRYDLAMAAVGVEMTHHLAATLDRVADAD